MSCHESTGRMTVGRQDRRVPMASPCRLGPACRYRRARLRRCAARASERANWALHTCASTELRPGTASSLSASRNSSSTPSSTSRRPVTASSGSKIIDNTIRAVRSSWTTWLRVVFAVGFSHSYKEVRAATREPEGSMNANAGVECMMRQVLLILRVLRALTHVLPPRRSNTCDERPAMFRLIWTLSVHTRDFLH